MHHRRGPGRRWRAKPARQPKCCISLEKAVSEELSNANTLLFLSKYCQKWSDRVVQQEGREIKENPGGRNRYGFHLNLLRKIADFGGSKGGPHGRGPGRRWRAKPARQPKCCISLEKAEIRGAQQCKYIVFSLELLPLGRRNHQKCLYFLQYFDFSSLRKGHRRQKCIVFAVPNGYREDMGGHQRLKKYYISCSILTFRVSGRAIADENVLFLLCQMVIGQIWEATKHQKNVVFLARF